MEMKAPMDSDGTLRAEAFRALVEVVHERTGRGPFLGGGLPRAVEAYGRSLVGRAFPSFWLEVPLMGEPGFDLHVYYDRGQVAPGERFAPGDGFGMQALFDWYFGTERGGVGVGFAHDLRGAGVATGAYVNFNGHPLTDARGFFSALDADEGHGLATALMGRVPEGWQPWYLGLFPERPGAGVRLGSFVSHGQKVGYAADQGLIAADLARAGYDAADAGMLRRVSEMASLPYGLELQLDATEAGTGPTLGVDLTLTPASAATVREAFAPGGPGAEACGLLQRWGVADDRWQLIPQAALSRIVGVDWAGSAISLLMTCTPVFIKVKWTDGEPLAAKVYLQCAARPLAPAQDGGAPGSV